MKKKIALALLAVALVVGGVAGGVYAVNGHQPVQGDKLVGNGPIGTIDHAAFTILQYSTFNFTNPDCVGEITINKVSIIRNPKDLALPPEVVYEGPYIHVTQEWIDSVWVTNREMVTRPMMPHESWSINLNSYIWSGLGADPDDPTDPGNWFNGPEAQAQTQAGYTVEIQWEAKK